MRILVVGAGAVGGLFGGRLAEAGRDVTFLVRPGRAEQITEGGLRIVGGPNPITIRPDLTRAGAIDAAYDLVIVSVKAYGLAAAISDFAPAVGRSTTILPLLNGIHHLDVLGDRFGGDAVLGGLSYLSANLDAEGRIHQMLDVQHLVFGGLQGRNGSRIRDLEKALQGAGFEVTSTEHILQEMWKKWIFIAAGSAVTCLFRGAVGEVAAIPGGADLSKAILDECAAVAEACGFPLPAEFLDECAAGITQKGSSFAASMYYDMMAGSPVEVDQIHGDLLLRARQRGVRAPLLTAAYIALKVYSARIDEQKTHA